MFVQANSDLLNRLYVIFRFFLAINHVPMVNGEYILSMGLNLIWKPVTSPRALTSTMYTVLMPPDSVEHSSDLFGTRLTGHHSGPAVNHVPSAGPSGLP